MNKFEYIIGIDPDSDRHGVAVYQNGKLNHLAMHTLQELISKWMVGGLSVAFSIENTMANQFVYSRNQHSSKAAQSKIAMQIGRCQQSQVELQRMLDYYEIPYTLHKPTKANFSKDKPMFERLTGWKERSNEDTRSAAYFGLLEAAS